MQKFVFSMQDKVDYARASVALVKDVYRRRLQTGYIAPPPPPDPSQPLDNATHSHKPSTHHHKSPSPPSDMNGALCGSPVGDLSD